MADKPRSPNPNAAHHSKTAAHPDETHTAHSSANESTSPQERSPQLPAKHSALRSHVPQRHSYAQSSPSALHPACRCFETLRITLRACSRGFSSFSVSTQNWYDHLLTSLSIAVYQGSTMRTLHLITAATLLASSLLSAQPPATTAI